MLDESLGVCGVANISIDPFVLVLDVLSSRSFFLAGVRTCGAVILFTFSQLLTASAHPFLDSKSQKWLSAPGICIVSNVNDLRYSAHLFNRSLAATDIVHVLHGPSSTYVSDL